MKKIYIPKKETKTSLWRLVVFWGGVSFVFGGLIAGSVVLSLKFHQHAVPSSPPMLLAHPSVISQQSSSNILLGQRVMVAIVAFDFSQMPHLEEVLDGYHDLARAGSVVDVYIYATIAYPVTILDLWNSRFDSDDFSITIVLKPKSLRLHLVDCHRKLFYDRIQDYDLFIYSEDDIRVRPTTVATYLEQSRRIAHLTGDKFSDYNVGIVRYEYNYPANVVIDDKTRHATQNVTRTYWEHSGFTRPVVPNAADRLDGDVGDRYLTMKNHHQGMYLATRDLLLAWKERTNCRFHEARNRPGKGSQPTEGTQRVWMSSQMLYGGRHCGVTQAIPIDKFGALTVLHLPNKNYRRVGKYRNRTFSDGTETFEQPSDRLLTAMEFHLGFRSVYGGAPQNPYRGIRMVDEVNHAADRNALLERRMKEYEAYVKRGGVLSDDDMKKTVLTEDS